MDPNSKTYPLSYPQRSIWHLEIMYPGTSIGNIAATLKVSLELDFDILEKAINMYIKNNDAVRLRTSERNGEPKQYLPEYTFRKLDFFDYSDRDIKELYEWDQKVTRTPVYAPDSDLYYFAMIRISKNLCGFYVKLHHMISDAWTLVNLGNEIMGYYDNILQGNDNKLVQKPSYLDFLNSEAAYIDSERFKRDEEYWLSLFKKIPEMTTLKGRQTALDNIKAKRKTYVLPYKLCAKIRSHCAEYKSSIFSMYMAALSIYFNRTKGDEEIIFGTPVLNRLNAKEKDTTGMYINTVPIRARIDDTQSFIEFSDTIAKEWACILKHQKYPYLLLLKNLRSKNPWLEKLYDIVLSYQNAKVLKKDKEYEQEGRWHFNGHQTESLNIHINDREDDGKIIIDYDYLADLFYAKEIDSLHDHVIRLLWHAIDNPGRKLPDIEMISESEKQKVLYSFNDTVAAYPKDKTIDVLFRDQAAKTPDAVAYIFNDKQLTYRELDISSDRMALLLKEKGLGKGQIAALMLSRSLNLPVCMLAVIKSGAAYMPMDPDHPPERIKLMLNDSGCSVLITDQEIKKKDSFGVRVISPDQASAIKAKMPVIKSNNSPGDVIYVIYTSGSTGMPKGVAVTHKNVVNLVYAVKSLADYEQKTVLSKTTVTFDVFVLEFFVPLLNGCTVILSDDQDQKNHQRLNELIKKHNVQIIHSTPSRLKEMLSQIGSAKAFSCLEQITTGGETLTPDILKKIKSISSARIYNVYGPTETTVYSTFSDVTDHDVITIGKPINNTKVLILDKHKNLLPIGIRGDMYVLGEGVSKGYLNRDDMTAERFSESKFFPGEVMYKTGDIARWYPMGDIEFAGRQDHQVKIRGLRIELDEIKSRIISYEGIKDAAVTICENNGQKMICAYMVCDVGVNTGYLKRYLAKYLPKYMMPSYYSRIDHIPVTPNGKLDPARLPVPEFQKRSRRRQIKPVGDIQTAVAQKFLTVLDLEEISIYDHFIELGGDSLGVTQLLVLLDEFGIPLSINDIYKNPTVKKLSSLIEKRLITGAVHSLEQTKKINRSAPAKSALIQIDSAAITYIPDEFSSFPGIWDEPLLFSHIRTGHGNIGLYTVPVLAGRIYNDKDMLIKQCTKASCMANRLGAKVVSLTGLIPSVTSYGYEIAEKLKEESCNVSLTTGHTTTAAAVVLTVERILSECGRELEDERVAFVGVGSVGSAVAKTMLFVLAHPDSIILCDIDKRKAYLEDFSYELYAAFGFDGNVDIAPVHGIHAPDKVYDATLIIGAANVTDVIDVSKLKAGTIIVDDSGPHCFNVEKGVSRLEKKHDILFTEGGVLESIDPIDKKLFIPEVIDDKTDIIKRYFNSDNSITGCILSGLLSSRYPQILPLLGTVATDDCVQNYMFLKQLGYMGAAPHCDNYIIASDRILSFKNTYRRYTHKKFVPLRQQI